MDACTMKMPLIVVSADENATYSGECMPRIYDDIRNIRYKLKERQKKTGVEFVHE